MTSQVRNALVSDDAAARRETWIVRGSVIAGLVVLVVAYLVLLQTSGLGPTCPAVYPPPPGCEPDRGADTAVALAFPFGAVAGALVAALALRRWSLPWRVVLLLVLVGVCVAGVVSVGVVRGSIG